MSKTKWFKSSRKADLLPINSRIVFGELPYAPIWEKQEKGWFQIGSSWPFGWDARTMINYNNSKLFQVIEEK